MSWLLQLAGLVSVVCCGLCALSGLIAARHRNGVRGSHAATFGLVFLLAVIALTAFIVGR